MQPPTPNAPCWCGSNRPFGACCAPSFAASTAAWWRMRRMARRLTDAIARHAIETWGGEIRDDALRWFRGRRSLDLRDESDLFNRWFAFTWIANWAPELDVPASWPTAPLGLHWLQHTTSRIGDDEYRFVMTASRSPCSLLLVEAVIPGWTMDVKDLFTGRRLRVVEPRLSARARPEEVIAAAVLTLDDISALIGPGGRLLPSSYREEVPETCRCYDGDRWFDAETMLDHEWEMHHLYLDAIDGDANRNLRVMHPRDAPFEPALLRWSLAVPFEDALERLRPLTVCFEDEEAIDLVHTPDGRPEARLSWYEPGPIPDPDDWREVALMYLDEGRLAAEAATAARAEALAREIAGRFGSAATLIEWRRDADPNARGAARGRRR